MLVGGEPALEPQPDSKVQGLPTMSVARIAQLPSEDKGGWVLAKGHWNGQGARAGEGSQSCSSALHSPL